MTISGAIKNNELDILNIDVIIKLNYITLYYGYHVGVYFISLPPHNNLLI